MTFLPDWSEWIRSHMVDIPKLTADFCGDLSGLKVLDVGCGDMIADVGLLSLGIDHITCLDVMQREWEVQEQAVREIKKAGFAVPPEHRSRLTYITYGGSVFPFPDNHFDFVFSWSAFEHILDVPAVLKEIRRVLKPFGRAFIQVYPWFPSFLGSHITDFIEEPFFHLKHSDEWVQSKLAEYAAVHPEKADLVLNHMGREYLTLNRYSAQRFLSDVTQVGFCVERMRTTIDESELSRAPLTIPIADIISYGSMLLMHPAKSFTKEGLTTAKLREQARNAKAELGRARAELETERAIRLGMQQSKSWRVTGPLRKFADLVRALRLH